MDLGSLPGIWVSASFLQVRVTIAWGRIGSETKQAENGHEQLLGKGAPLGSIPFPGLAPEWGQACLEDSCVTWAGDT